MRRGRLLEWRERHSRRWQHHRPTWWAEDTGTSVPFSPPFSPAPARGSGHNISRVRYKLKPGNDDSADTLLECRPQIGRNAPEV